jgi:hypothetical protein
VSAKGGSENAASAELQRQELQEKYPDLSSVASGALEPIHPFYALELQRFPRRVEWHLVRREGATAWLSVNSSRCPSVRRISMLVEPGEAQLEPFEVPEPARSNTNVSLRRLAFRLPFAAFGRTLQVIVEPTDCSAREVIFNGNELATTLAHTAASTHLARPRPSRPGTATPPEECLPPQYCQD